MSVLNNNIDFKIMIVYVALTKIRIVKEESNYWQVHVTKERGNNNGYLEFRRIGVNTSLVSGATEYCSRTKLLQ